MWVPTAENYRGVVVVLPLAPAPVVPEALEPVPGFVLMDEPVVLLMEEPDVLLTEEPVPPVEGVVDIAPAVPLDVPDVPAEGGQLAVAGPLVDALPAAAEDGVAPVPLVAPTPRLGELVPVVLAVVLGQGLVVPVELPRPLLD